MKTAILFPAILFLPILLHSQEKNNILTTEEFAAGWELLFDGETLKGWKAYNGDAPKTWNVDENSIHCDGTNGGDDIMTVETFGDFDLMFAWKYRKMGIAGSFTEYGKVSNGAKPIVLVQNTRYLMIRINSIKTPPVHFMMFMELPRIKKYILPCSGIREG
jgi:hypothetical protein